MQARLWSKSQIAMPAKKKQLLVLNGPNLNLLGARERQHYGTDTLETITGRLTGRAQQAGARLTAFQSNSEAALVERIHQARKDGIDFIIINPAAFTHTSVAMRDALAAVGIPFIEVHLSNVFAREAFRRESYFTDIAVGIISGLGASGYELALEFALQQGFHRDGVRRNPQAKPQGKKRQ
jgi:3-dehydroquinate dehydratase-2